MNILNELFEKIFIISSHNTHKRLNKLIPYLKYNNINYEIVISPKQYHLKPDYSVTNITHGAESLISANESIFIKSIIDNYDNICIMEDDIYFSPLYKQNLKEFFNILDPWDVLNLGHHTHTHINFETEIIHPIKSSDVIIGTHCMCYTKKLYPILLEHLEKNIEPLDLFLYKILYNQYRSYMPVKKIFYASSYRLNDDNKIYDYKIYPSEIR